MSRDFLTPQQSNLLPLRGEETIKQLSSHPNIKRKNENILGDTSRVITRFHLPEDRHRIPKIIQRVVDLPERIAENLLEKIMLEFSERHKDIRHVFERHLNKANAFVPRDIVLSKVKRALIGAY
jgi:hypothetical protein